MRLVVGLGSVDWSLCWRRSSGLVSGGCGRRIQRTRSGVCWISAFRLAFALFRRRSLLQNGRLRHPF